MEEMEEITFEEPKIILLSGKPKRGKSNTIRFFILDNSVGSKKTFKFGIVFTRTKFNKDYDYLPDEYVIGSYDEEILKNYLDMLENIKNEGKDIEPNFIIFDDLMGLLSTRNGFLNNLFAVHRHFNTSIFLAVQHIVGASTSFREIVSIAILYNTKRKASLVKFYEEFGQLFDDFDSFKRHFFDITENEFTGMLYNQDEDNLEENYLSFKAPDMSKIDVKLKF